MKLTFIFAAALFFAGGIAAEAQPAEATFALTNVHVATMTSDKVLPKQTLLVKDGKITALGPMAEIPIPEDSVVVDGGGGVVIPGLHDLHAHVGDPADLPLYLARGVTSVLTLNGGSATLARRSEIESGALAGPRLMVTGPPIIDLESVAGARKLVEEQSQAGFDGIKIYNGVSVQALRELVTQARKRGMISIGHIPRNLTWQEALDAGPDGIAHAEEFLYSPVLEGDEEKIAAAMLEGNVSLVTTLVAYDAIGRQVADLGMMFDRSELRYVPLVTQRGWERSRNTYARRFNAARVPNLRRLLAFQRTLIRDLRAKGVVILVGTDAGGVPFVHPGSSVHDEIANLVAAGLTSYEALRAATADAAKFLGHDESLGTIGVGKDADFVLLRGNPLNDIESIRLVGGVMARGRWFSQECLREMLDGVAAENENERPFFDALAGTGLVNALEGAAKELVVRERTLNELGYQFLYVDDDERSAILTFEAAVHLSPRSWNAWDSLGEALAHAGEHERAAESYRRSLALNPSNQNAALKLRELDL